MADTATIASGKNKIAMHEDWAVVVLGFAIIALMVGGLLIPVPAFSWSNAADLSQVFTLSNGIHIGSQFLLIYVFSVLGTWLTNKQVKHMIIVFPIIYFLTVIALILAGNSQIKALNLEAVIFSLAIGLLVGNTLHLPEWFRAILSTELFVKIGLVLLGTGIIFSDILTAGSLGLIQALIVVVTVWYFAYWICKKLKIDEELGIMISSAVSICGVSAAIATAGAIKGDTKKLSYVISLVLITAIPMMIVMPAIANYYNFPQEVTGAWLGGSIDTTGAVVASGTLVGDTALKISTIVKFSQNVLLGLAAFAISIYWTYTSKGSAETRVEKPTLRVIWDRFPKFVLGFIVASLFFSFVLSPTVVSEVKGSLKSLQTLWFVLAFTSIGLETKFSDIFNSKSKRPLFAFVTAQLFNILVTLVVAFFLFG
jgi:uncharacterized integral membrane protein (TIGR00698 family)